ncbi:MAG: hypothetical protein PHZ00_03445 [Candidatus Peribacteraceae bacterium]|nr:hypothetical protein [Candidatus Peribacteraceae bacterium]
MFEQNAPISRQLLDEFRAILREEYGLEPSEAEAREMAENILRHYRTAERLLNRLP